MEYNGEELGKADGTQTTEEAWARLTRILARMAAAVNILETRIEKLEDAEHDRVLAEAWKRNHGA